MTIQSGTTQHWTVKSGRQKTWMKDNVGRDTPVRFIKCNHHLAGGNVHYDIYSRLDHATHPSRPVATGYDGCTWWSWIDKNAEAVFNNAWQGNKMIGVTEITPHNLRAEITKHVQEEQFRQAGGWPMAIFAMIALAVVLIGGAWITAGPDGKRGCQSSYDTTVDGRSCANLGHKGLF